MLFKSAAEVTMSFEELIVAARVEDLRRDIARWERGQSAVAELRDAHHEPKPRFGFRRRSPRRAWSLNRETSE